MSDQLRFTILGPVRAWNGTEELNTGSPQQRTVLAALLLAEGQSVSVDRLVDLVWETNTPPSAVITLRTYIHRLRKSFSVAGDPRSILASAHYGYRLTVPGDRLDSVVFQGLVKQAQDLVMQGRPQEAAQILNRALGLWQGPALSGLHGEFVASQRRTLHEQRLLAETLLVETDLELDSPTTAVGKLTQLVQEHPLDERLRELQMLALYRSGRQAAALETYHAVQELLSAELGIDPGPGLQEMHQRVLQADPALVQLPELQPAVAAPAPAQLPAALASFSGREEELKTALTFTPQSGPQISVVTGMAGVGKTTFAVHWARQVAQSFPDGQLYLDLHGFDQARAPLTSSRAMVSVLESLGAGLEGLPNDEDALAAYYRSWMSGKNVFLLLDNARDAAQVRLLIPGTPGCHVLVTSRDQMVSLVTVEGAYPIPLDVLSVAQSRRLLARRLGDLRADAEPEAVDEIIELCRRLPLALAVTAGRAALRPTTPLSSIAADLRAHSSRLDAFQSQDARIDVRSVFSYSYQALSPDAARLFRLLAVHPAFDAGLGALASLAGQPFSETRLLLDQLTQASLVEERTGGRFSVHDLLRLYAADLLASEERETALRRLLSHFLHTGAEARVLFTSSPAAVNLPAPVPGIHRQEFGDANTRTRAGQWFETEQSVLLACIDLAAELDPKLGLSAYAWKLAWILRPYLDRTFRWGDLAATHQAGLAASLRQGDLLGEAHMRRGLARATTVFGDAEAGRQHIERALTVFVEHADPATVGEAYRQAAWIGEQAGDIPQALHYAQQALDYSRPQGDATATARALNAVAWFEVTIGRCEQAIQLCREAIPLHESTDDVGGAADTYDTLALAHHKMRNFEPALDAYQEAMDRYWAGGAPYNFAHTLDHIAETYVSMGQFAEARDAWQRAIDIFATLDDSRTDALRQKIAALIN